MYWIKPSLDPGILFSDVSDHLPIFQFTTLSVKKEQHFEYSSRYDNQHFSNLNFTDLILSLCSIKWSGIETCEDVNQSYSILLETLTKVCTNHTIKQAPNRTKR